MEDEEEERQEKQKKALRRKEHTPHPEWLHVPKPGGEDYMRLKKSLRKEAKPG